MSEDNKPEINITSYNQSGGITAHTVNIGMQTRHLDLQEASQLDQHLLQFKSTAVRVTSVLGDQEAFLFANEIKDYLTSKGFAVAGVDLARYTQPVVGKFIRQSNNVIEIIIGSNR